MSLAENATFGSGGSEPYAHALRAGELLYLRDSRDSTRDSVVMDVSRWNADADQADLTLLASVTGPLLDVGCGPGRMVRAAQKLGISAVGIDVSSAAVEFASQLGGTIIQGSVFDRVPAEGTWQTVLLVDGNIGIGGDVRALLVRCAELLSPTGEIVVEVHTDPEHMRHYLGEVVDTAGHQSALFPWAEIGRDRLVAMLPAIGLRPVQSWEIDGRSFCRLATTR